MTATSATLGYPGIPLTGKSGAEHRRVIAQAVNRLNRGILNCHLDVTLGANTATTMITSASIGYWTAIIAAMPMTADAAADIGTIWVDTITAGVGATSATAVIHHRSNSATDRTIRFVLLG